MPDARIRQQIALLAARMMYSREEKEYFTAKRKAARTVGLDCKVGGAVGIDYNALLNRSRVAQAAMAVGVARQAFEYARDYAKQRVQFGVAIAQKQAIAFIGL